MVGLSFNTTLLQRPATARLIGVGSTRHYGSRGSSCSSKGHLAIVSRLQAAGAEVSHSGWNALLYAAFEGHTDVCRFLLAKGAEIDAQAPNGATALMIASRQGHLETVRLLLWEDSDPQIRTDSGATALQWALKAGNSEIAKLLQQAGAKE